MQEHRILSATNAEMVRSMLRLKQDAPIPQRLLDKLYIHKLMIDRVTGRLFPGDIARMAMELGFNPETNSFPETLPEHIVQPPEPDPEPEKEPEAEPDEKEVFGDESGPEPAYSVGASVSFMDDDNNKVTGTVLSVTIDNEDVIYELEMESGEPTVKYEDEIDA